MGQNCKSRMKSRCLESEWVGVGGTWLQLMYCATLHRRVPDFRRQGLGRRLEIGDDFVIKGKSRTRTMRRRIQVIEQEEDYVKDKSIFELKKHTGVYPTYIV